MDDPTESTGPAARYERALAQGTLVLQRCRGCARHIFHPRVLCPHCGSTDLETQGSRGLGVVYSTTIVRRRPEQGGDIQVALVDLDEGVRVMSRVEGLAADDVKIGLRVQAQICKPPHRAFASAAEAADDAKASKASKVAEAAEAAEIRPLLVFTPFEEMSA
ncbi:Zn-ribbon domain-containing OB-fold protein [Castellaniella sp.]|uniref:Zn-ribbon domain-containing OB-fold protein n=1 Tax=Castellaniella sp. TaxID=1955812 RepID=UPI00355F4A3B